MALTKISQKVLLEIRDGDKKIQIKDMTQKENDILRKLDDGAFMSLSGTVMSKEKYSNLQDYINEKINQDEYENKAKYLDGISLSELNPYTGKVIRQFEKLEQYDEQVILINENAINCYRKLGFKEIGKRRQSVYRERTFHDTIFMDILADDFYKQ